MTKRSTTGLRPDNGRGDLRPIRLVLEPLEARRLLAGVDFAGTCDHLAIPSLNSTGSALPLTQQPIDPQQPLVIQQIDLQAEGESRENDFSIPENAPLGTLLGFFDMVDPTVAGTTIIEVGDARFSVQGNQLYFTSGKLDYETEPLISFSITLVNEFARYFDTIDAKVSVSDVNERPLSIELSGGKVPEHEPGAFVGGLTVVDPDSQGNYAFYIFDSRFVLSGNQLKLADGIELDYETEPEVMLAIAATDGTFEVFDTVRIEVLPTPDAPVLASSITLDAQELTELTAGAGVGLATVVNPKDGSYQFSVSDARFEMRGNRLKLRDDQQVNALVESEISLTLTALGDHGDEASGTFTISVTSIRSPYHNHNLNEDVNGDGYISPIDALLIINDLNSNGAHPVPSGVGATGEPPSEMLDVNGDGLITPMDVLLIINRLNSRAAAQNQRDSSSTSSPASDPQDDSSVGVGSRGSIAPTIVDSGLDGANAITPNRDESTATIIAPSAPAYATASVAPTVFDLANERRQRENASIDAELETLLDQLSREQASS